MDLATRSSSSFSFELDEPLAALMSFSERYPAMVLMLRNEAEPAPEVRRKMAWLMRQSGEAVNKSRS